MAQHDYVIDNASGATVRADINSALGAIQSLNSGTSAPSSTTAGMLWLDTTGGAPYALKVRDAGNNHWLTLGNVTDPGADGNLELLPGKINLPSSGGVYESDGSTEVLTESSGAVTLKNTTLDSTVIFPVGGTSPIAYAHIADVKSSGTSGGDFNSGDWRTRDLNTEISDANGIVSISSNQFTLIAGTYVINFRAAGYKTGSHQTRLYDVTGSAILALGSTEYVSTADNTQSNSIGSFIHSPSSNNTYEIQHRCATTSSTFGFGVNSNFADNHYTTVIIYKLK